MSLENIGDDIRSLWSSHPTIASRMAEVINERDFLKSRAAAAKSESGNYAQQIRDAVKGIDGAEYWAPLEAVRHIAKEVHRLRAELEAHVKEIKRLRFEAESLQVETWK